MTRIGAQRHPDGRTGRAISIDGEEMSIQTYDFEVKQGNTGTVQNPDGLVVRLGERDLNGAEIVFFAHWSGQTRLRRSSADGALIVDPALGRITVPFGVQDFRAVRPGVTVHYEIEVRKDGQQRCVLEGNITVMEGVNDD